MARILVERLLAADPTSTALLMSGPSGLDLWPGIRHVSGSRGHLVVDADIPSWRATRPVQVTVRALPPHRTPTTYVIRFDFSGEGVPNTKGVLTLSYEPVRGGAGTCALLSLEYATRTGEGRALDRMRAAMAMRGLAEEFLANLAAVAEARAEAA